LKSMIGLSVENITDDLSMTVKNTRSKSVFCVETTNQYDIYSSPL
jgi:hypothetical protein